MAGKPKTKKRAKKDVHAEHIAAETARLRALSALHEDVHPEIKKTVGAILFFVLTVLFVLSYTGNAGNAGRIISSVFTFLLGNGYFFAPLTCLLIGFSLIFSPGKRMFGVPVLGGGLFLFSNLALLHVLFGSRKGGVIGSVLGAPLVNLFDFWASILIVGSLIAVSLLLMLNVPFWKRVYEEEDEEEEDTAAVREGMLDHINNAIKSALEKKGAEAETAPPTKVFAAENAAAGLALAAAAPKDEATISLRKVTKKFDYKKPPLELLQGDRGTPSSGDIRANANIIKRTLENFGITVEMAEVSIGPTVTQYTLKPAEGVKLSRITGLNNDLSLALAAHPIRIEAPIPGKSLVGIEVPNRSIALVGLRSLLEQKTFQDTAAPLLFALGRDVTGAPVFTDLAKCPHMLVSGATGSGKSVAMHAIITSLLYRNPPQMLRFIIVDPKRVELSAYNDIPHLLTPVITDSKTTVQALRWATKEMDRRYELLSMHHARDIVSYNSEVVKSQAKAKEDGEEREILPYIVIIIDELADLMATFPREVEASIIRLAQMARAVGIHLIVATQRPSVEVITGLIKANITARLALQVASQIDSRTILDASGAEKLLGNGDMLFIAGDTSRPRRIQGAFVSEQEVKRVVDFLREEAEAPEYDDAIIATKLDDEARSLQGEEDTDDDPLYNEAKDLVVQAGKASASYLQRRLRVGYARAARLLDLLETNGVIGPGDGAKPREVLMNTQDLAADQILEN